MTISADQLPEGWSEGAEGYQDNFAGFTGLYADPVLDLVEVSSGTELLDVAAGTGATSLRAAARGAVVTAVDFAPGMVRIAAERLADAGFGDAVVAEMDGQDLDLPDDTFDAAVSMFGLMFFPDAAAGVGELRRVVRAGGRLAVGTWDLDQYGMHRLIRVALEVAVPELADAPAPRPTWAPLGTSEGLAGLLQAAGLGDVRVERIEQRWHFEDPERFFRDMPSWSCPVRPLFEMLPADRIDAAARAFADAVAEQDGLPGGDGVAMGALAGIAVVG